MTEKRFRYKYTTMRQENGDDGYCYVVRLNGKAVDTGLTRRQAQELRLKLEKEAQAKAAKQPKPLTIGAVLASKTPVPKPKKYYLRNLEAFDATAGESVVRELEMDVDNILSHSAGRIMQFWRDVQLYGVDEAITYVRNEDADEADAIQVKWEGIRERMAGVLAKL